MAGITIRSINISKMLVSLIFTLPYLFKKKIVVGTIAILIPKDNAILSIKSISFLSKITRLHAYPGRNKTNISPIKALIISIIPIKPPSFISQFFNVSFMEYKFNNIYPLIIILAIGAFFAYLPHMGYDYPLHRDEWDRLTIAKAYIREGKTEIIDPFIGERAMKNYLEVGFVLWLIALKLTSGLSWLFIFKYFPIFVTCLLILFTYILCNRLGYGLEAAFLVSLIPTSVRILGPAFLVPVALCMTFIPLCLFILFNFNEKSKFLVYSFFLVFLLYSHPPTAVATIIFSGIFILLEKKYEVLPYIFLAILISLPQYINIILEKGLEATVFSTFVRFSYIFKEYGFLPTFFFVMGSYFVLKKWDRNVVFVFCAIVLLFINFIFRRFHETFLIVPERNYLYLMIIMAIVGGYALKERIWKTSKQKEIFLIVLILLAFTEAAIKHYEEPYYHIINDKEYQDFLWVKENIKDGKAIIDPWKAAAFTAVAEKYVYTTISLGPREPGPSRNKEVIIFFENNCSNTDFLKNNRISIIYSYVECENPELKKLRSRIYIAR